MNFVPTIVSNWTAIPAAIVNFSLDQEEYRAFWKVVYMTTTVGAGIGTWVALTSSMGIAMGTLPGTANILKHVTHSIFGWTWEGAKVGMVSSATVNIAKRVFG